MPITLSADDVTFLRQAQELGAEGLSQEEMAVRMNLHPSTFRARIRNLGFQFTRQTVLATTLGGEALNDLLASGEIVAAEKEPVAV